MSWAVINSDPHVERGLSDFWVNALPARSIPLSAPGGRGVFFRNSNYRALAANM
jgi:hypothetical protein